MHPGDRDMEDLSLCERCETSLFHCLMRLQVAGFEGLRLSVNFMGSNAAHEYIVAAYFKGHAVMNIYASLIYFRVICHLLYPKTWICGISHEKVDFLVNSFPKLRLKPFVVSGKWC